LNIRLWELILNKQLYKAVQCDVLHWIADYGQLMNSSIIFSIDTLSWHYFYDNPITGTPEDKELTCGRYLSVEYSKEHLLNMISEIRIIERLVIEQCELILGQEYEDSDDLTDTERHRLDVLGIDYKHLCGTC